MKHKSNQLLTSHKSGELRGEMSFDSGCIPREEPQLIIMGQENDGYESPGGGVHQTMRTAREGDSSDEDDFFDALEHI